MAQRIAYATACHAVLRSLAADCPLLEQQLARSDKKTKRYIDPFIFKRVRTRLPTLVLAIRSFKTPWCCHCRALLFNLCFASLRQCIPLALSVMRHINRDLAFLQVCVMMIVVVVVVHEELS